MLLIYSPHITPRLEYIVQFIFNEQLGISVSLTSNEIQFKEFSGAKINYSKQRLNDELYFNAAGLLSEQGIKKQHIVPEVYDHEPIFYRTPNADYPFDLFSASFYLISRYEEYLPHESDKYGRYAHSNSLAYQNGFLHKPIVNTWIVQFGTFLLQKYPGLHLKQQKFQFVATYDIDIAFSYKHKGWIRNLGGMLRNPSLERLSVLANRKKDPFDSYDFLDALHAEYPLKPIYFFPTATKRGRYDKNLNPHVPQMKRLIQLHQSKYTIGLHSSWKSNDDVAILQQEKKLLDSISGHSTINSRQHYIKFKLPETYRNLIACGLQRDYSMGYGSINGFRASVASSFYWYDLEKETQTTLRIYPFCFMDANCHYEEKQSAKNSFLEMEQYFDRCSAVNGLFISIFHNNFLGKSAEFSGWRTGYNEFIARAQQWL